MYTPTFSLSQDATLTIGWVKLTAKDAAHPPSTMDCTKLAFFGVSVDMMMIYLNRKYLADSIVLNMLVLE
jgi:hypothetical protein